MSQSLTVNGERTTFGYTHDAGGNLTQRTNSDGSKTLYTYDDADRLIRIETRDPNNAPLHKSEFTYDGFSRKAISKEFGFTGGAWTLQSETRRVFDGLDCVQERNAQNEVVASYTRDGNIGGILSRTSASGKSYYHYDGGGNVTQLTDETGETVARYAYDAFGNTLEASGSRAGENLYRFSTKEFHASSGLYDYGYRFYSPSMGRWINRDPIQEDGGINLYAAFVSNPVNQWDEYGESPGDIADVVAIGISIGDFVKKPSLKNGAWVVCDVITAMVPVAPGTGPVRHAGKLLKRGKGKPKTKKPNGNRRDNPARTHLYRIDYRGENGDWNLYRVGISSGTTVGSQSRMSVGIRHGKKKFPNWQFRANVHKWFPNRNRARLYETAILDRYKRRYGHYPIGNTVNR